jgi:hypothetical protein
MSLSSFKYIKELYYKLSHNPLPPFLELETCFYQSFRLGNLVRATGTAVVYILKNTKQKLTE